MDLNVFILTNREVLEKLVYRTLYNLLKSQNKKICWMAFTEIAATLLPNEKTVHKVLRLPVHLLSDSSSNCSVPAMKRTIF